VRRNLAVRSIDHKSSFIGHDTQDFRESIQPVGPLL
jgi:hypothetical protein